MLLGTSTRTPGQYKRLDSKTGEATKTPMCDTNEHIHPSVRSRIKLDGPGLANKGVYKPDALKEFDLVQSGDEGPSAVHWELRKSDASGSDVILQEDKLGENELKLLKKSPKIYDFITNDH